MCFSATASFSSGIILSAIGVAAVQKTTRPTQLLLASFPFLFAFQQFTEGFLWLSFTNPAYAGWHDVSKYGFLIFSHLLWPVFIPLAILLLEDIPKRKTILYYLLGAGLLLAGYHFYCLVFLDVTARVDHHHIIYLIDHLTEMLLPANILYGLSTIVPAFVSSVKRMWWIGLFIIITYMATYVFYFEYTISIWCFLATLLSLLVYFILNKLNNRTVISNVAVKR